MKLSFSKKKEMYYPKVQTPYTNLGNGDLGNLFGKRIKRIGPLVRIERFLEKYMKLISVVIFFGVLIAVCVHVLFFRS